MARKERKRHMTPRDVATAVKIYGDDLPELTEKQQAFLNCLLQGKNAMTAYRLSYDTAGTDNTVAGNSCRLYHNPKIQAWLTAAKQAHLGAAVITRENHLREMERLREIAVESGDLRSAVKAEEVRGFVAGLRIERAEITVNNPAAILAEISRINPAIAEQLAEQYAINLHTKTIEHEA